MHENTNKYISPEPITATHLHALGSNKGIPIGGTFELTARCNFNCKMCYVHLQDDPAKLMANEISADNWLELAKKARDAGMLFLLLTGGEPFIRRDFAYIYEELVKMGLVVSINTNASLYSPEIRELFKKYPPSRINVTLYGGSEETYSNLCGNASFKRVYNNLKMMKEDGLQVRLNVSLTPYNVSDMQKIRDISAELNFPAKAATYMYPPIRVSGCIGENPARFTAEEAGNAIARWYSIYDDREYFLKKAENLRSCHGIDDDETCSDPEQDGMQCRAGRSAFWITWDGRMLPCGTMDIEASLPFEQGFDDAWQQVRRRVAEIRLPVECSSCKEKRICGACASICKCETGKFDEKPEYLCNMTRAKIEEIRVISHQMENRDED